jgi:uncharacterized protein YegL
MVSIATDIIGGYNRFIEDQKKLNIGTCDVSFYQFDDQYDAVYENVDIKSVKELNGETFVPRGSTALYDAIGRTIKSVGANLAKLNESERPDKVLVVIITDGYENASQEFTAQTVKALIDEQTNKYSWVFTYIGANQNAWSVGANLGIAKGRSLTYAANAGGATAMFTSLSVNASSLRSSDASNIQFQYSAEDIQKQEDAGVKATSNTIPDKGRGIAINPLKNAIAV